MCLSNKLILEEMSKGDIVIDPFERKNLKTSSYDVTLGSRFYRTRRDGHREESNVCNIYSKKGLEEFWDTQALEAESAEEILGKDFDFDGVKPDDKIIMLAPGELILAHTNEFIGGRNHITTMMKARSSMGRWDITVCKCAGWGDVGFFNRWTMEIKNENDLWWRFLIVGEPVAQIEFFETGEILSEDYSKTGKYQNSNDLEELKRSWSPEMMLPRLYKDRKGK